MSVIYRFAVQGVCCRCGKPGPIRGGYVAGDYTLLDAVHWAIADVVSGAREPLLIAAHGRVFFDAATIRAATRCPEPDPRGTCRCVGAPPPSA